MRTTSMRRSLAFLIGLALSAPSLATAQVQDAASPDANEIVVTAQRTGAPVWRVTSGTTTLILIGSIGSITKDTSWRPEALAQALRGADQVMYPSMLGITASPFQAIGWYAKWRKQASLPKGTTLLSMLSASQLARLSALEKRGLLRSGFERRHPLHLARELEKAVEEQVKLGPSLTREVDRAVKAHKLRKVPIVTRKGKPLVTDLFSSRPERHVPCLEAAIALAEAGPAAITNRSRNWAARRVPEALASPINRVEATCWPAGAQGTPTKADIAATARRLLAERKVTVAVVPLAKLAGTDGVLGALENAGFDIAGPRWRR